MRKLVLIAALAAIAATAALAVPSRAPAQSTPFVNARTALASCLAEQQASPAAFRRQYGVGFWRFSPLARCFLFKLTAPSTTPPPPPPPAAPPPPPPPPSDGF